MSFFLYVLKVTDFIEYVQVVKGYELVNMYKDTIDRYCDHRMVLDYA